MSGNSFISDHRSPISDLSSAKTLRFGIICRFVEQKGIKYLLEALKTFSDRNGGVRFVFAGQGPLGEMIREFVDSNNLSGVEIRRVGNPVEILKEMDVFVHPSLDDAMPMSLTESLMCGVPVIASRVGGIPDLVRDGVEGFLIEPRRPEEIVERMERFMEMSEGQRSEFRRRARARYEEVCTPEKVGDAVELIYKQIINRAGRTDVSRRAR